MQFFVYILFSESLNKFYIGTTDDVTRRVEEHNNIKYYNKFTSRGVPWSLFFAITCQSSSQAYKIEKHIKFMHSAIYIENLVKYPEMTHKLWIKTKSCGLGI